MQKLCRRWCVALALLFVASTFTETVSAGDFPANNSREIRLLKAKVRAAQFLSKATFGPTQEAIDELALRMSQIGYRRAVSEWVDYQLDLPFTSHEQVARDIIETDNRTTTTQNVGIANYRYQAWWHIALTSEDQLKQRIAYALSQIFVIGDTGNRFNNDDDRDIGNGERSIAEWLGMSRYYDMLGEGSNGTYREMLEEVTYSPMMGVWLSSVRNRKANVSAGRFPDENYAREIMQLFSVGLYQMHQDGRLMVDENGELIPTYDNSQIRELSRVFTGFKYHHNTNGSFYVGQNYGDRMRVHPAEHDNNLNYSEEPNAPESKTVFGVTLPPLGQSLSEEDCNAEIGAALDVISEHQNVAPFISRLLIQRLVKSNPSRAYLRRVTRVFNDNGQGVRGDMRAVVKAILTDPELYRSQRLKRNRSPLSLSVLTRGSEYSRLKEPILRITSLIRAMRPTTDYAQGYMMLNGNNSFRDEIGQMPFRSPSVFNFYLPNFQPPGDLIGYTPSRRNPYGALYAPEFQIINGVTMNRTLNRLQRWAVDGRLTYGMRVGSCRITFNLEPELELAEDSQNLDEILQRFDLLLCNGTLSEESKTSIRNAVLSESNATPDERVETSLFLVLMSPDSAVEQ